MQVWRKMLCKHGALTLLVETARIVRSLAVDEGRAQPIAAAAAFRHGAFIHRISDVLDIALLTFSDRDWLSASDVPPFAAAQLHQHLLLDHTPVRSLMPMDA